MRGRMEPAICGWRVVVCTSGGAGREVVSSFGEGDRVVVCTWGIGGVHIWGRGDVMVVACSCGEGGRVVVCGGGEGMGQACGGGEGLPRERSRPLSGCQSVCRYVARLRPGRRSRRIGRSKPKATQEGRSGRWGVEGKAAYEGVGEWWAHTVTTREAMKLSI